MLKFTYPIGLGVAALAALPAAMSAQSLGGTTEEAIARTLAALEEMELISLAIQRQEPGSIQRVLDATEAAILPPAKQDEFLNQLRREIGELQLDVAAKTAVRAQQPSRPSTSTGKSTGASTNNLSRPRPRMTPPGSTPRIEPPRTQKEDPGFHADRLRQGRLLFRDERFDEAIEVLEKIEDSPEAEYWIARSYEAVGNVEEAILRYRALTTEPQDEGVARRAEHDLGFLEWKQRFYGSKAK